MRKPLVSILIPAYNAAQWIEETLRSATGQTWENKEIIVVDDGSKDRTLEIASQFKSLGVSVFSQTNHGAAAARNEAFRLSKGDYIQWLDADDILSPDKVERQMKECQGPWVLLSSAFGQFLYQPRRAVFEPTELWADLTPVEWMIRKMNHNRHMQTATWLVSRELTEKAGPWNTELLGDDDGEYFARVLLKSQRVHFVREGRVYYRASGNSSLSYIHGSERKIRAQWHSMKLCIGYLRSIEESERVHRACVQYINSWLINFYPDFDEILREAGQLVSELGGKLERPSFSWKYAWVNALFGWRAARCFERTAQSLRWTLQRNCEKTLYRLVEGSPVDIRKL